MIGWVTTRIDVIRDPAVSDDYSDDPDGTDPAPVIEDIPASILERTQRVASEGFRPVTYTVGRVGKAHDVRVGDRIKDRRTGTYYAVSLVKKQQNAMIAGDTRLELVSV